MKHFLCLSYVQGVNELPFRLGSFGFLYSLLRKIIGLQSLKLPLSYKLLLHIYIIIFLVHVPWGLLYCYFLFSMSQNHQNCWGIKHTFWVCSKKYGNCHTEISHPAITSGFLLWKHFCLALETGTEVPWVAYLGSNIQKEDISFWLHPAIFLCSEAWRLIFCNSSLASVIAAIFIFFI